MIRLVEFTQFWRVPPHHEECIVLKRIADANSISMSFPFHEDTPNFEFTIPDILKLRNAIDDLVAVKMLGEPENPYIVEPHKPTHITVGDKYKLLDILNNYPLYNEYDQGARQALRKVYSILNLENGRN